MWAWVYVCMCVCNILFFRTYMDASGLYSDDYKDQHGSTGEILGDSIVHRGDKSNTPAVN